MLHLRNCNLETLPDWLGELRELEELDLQLNPIKEWPESLFQLHQLQLLYVSDAKAEFPYDRLHAFPNLKSLLLAYMRMTEVPPSVRQLRNLRTLYLYNNQLQFLPDWLGELNHLRRLKVNGNQLESLPACLGRLGELEDLALEDNPKLGLPIEILAKDSARKILDYYFRTRASSAPQPLNEFKLILVGRGGVGKTTLVHRLQTGKFKEFRRTPGIKITQMPVTIAGEAVQAHVWDFGGQEIMHGTHRFFMTERALYVVLVSGREGTEDHDAEYWLSLVRSFAGDNASIIVLRHKWDDLHFELNTQLLRDKYGKNLVFLETDSHSGHGIMELHAQILKEAGSMPGLKARRVAAREG